MTQIYRLLSSMGMAGIILLTSAITQTPSQQVPSSQQQLVKLNVLVTDSSKHPVSDVKREEISVFEEGVPQTISFFSSEELPLVYGIAIDNSSSFKSVFKPVLEAAKIIVNNNKPSDETFLVRFIDADHIEKVKDFTSDKAALLGSLNTLRIEGGQTALLDAVYVSVQHIAQYKKGDGINRRRALILITDGEDRASFYNKDKVFDLLRSENIQIFPIGVVSILDNEGSFQRQSPRERAIDLLNGLAKESGGLAFFPKSPAELGRIAGEIVSYLRTQYVIGYTPSGKESKGGRRKVSVKVADIPGREKRIAITRSSYKIPRTGGSEK